MGQINAFCLSVYVDRLEKYFIANEIGSQAVGADDTAEAREIPQRKKVATFLTLVGPEAYRLLKSLLSPAIPASKTFPELIEVLGNHLKPKKLIVAERFRFHQRTQSEGETVAQFEAALRKLASTYDFELFLNQALRDQFVCGVRSEITQKKLLCAVTPSPDEYVELIEQLNESPVTAAHIRQWTTRDKTLSRVQRYILTGWPTKDPLTQDYSRFSDELSMHDGCITRGAIVVVP